MMGARRRPASRPSRRRCFLASMRAEPLMLADSSLPRPPRLAHLDHGVRRVVGLDLLGRFAGAGAAAPAAAAARGCPRRRAVLRSVGGAGRLVVRVGLPALGTSASTRSPVLLPALPRPDDPDRAATTARARPRRVLRWHHRRIRRLLRRLTCLGWAGRIRRCAAAAAFFGVRLRRRGSRLGVGEPGTAAPDGLGDLEQGCGRLAGSGVDGSALRGRLAAAVCFGGGLGGRLLGWRRLLLGSAVAAPEPVRPPARCLRPCASASAGLLSGCALARRGRLGTGGGSPPSSRGCALAWRSVGSLVVFAGCQVGHCGGGLRSRSRCGRGRHREPLRLRPGRARRKPVRSALPGCILRRRIHVGRWSARTRGQWVADRASHRSSRGP